MRQLIKRLPIVGPIAKTFYRKFFQQLKPFPGSNDYWVERYNSGGHSGPGSYNEFAVFKANTINRFVDQHQIRTIIEYGCGDGNQLKLATYPSYVGFDVSPKALELCHEAFGHDQTKKFKLLNAYAGETAQLTMSLDVIYHLIEDEVYHAYMDRLFESSEQYVIIYSSDDDEAQDYHQKGRRFTAWVQTNQPAWSLAQHIPNQFPYNKKTGEGSISDFYIYQKA